MAVPRIWKITYKSGVNRRVASTITKVPYAGMFALAEALTRASTKGDVAWFRVEPAKPTEITEEIRQSLQRWPQALGATSARTKVKWFQ